MKKYGFPLSLSVLALAILACADLTVRNDDAKEPAIVQVTLPGGNGGTRRLAPGEAFTWFASEAGEYSVWVVPIAEYLHQLQNLQESTADILKNPAAHSSTTLITAFNDTLGLQKRIDALAAGTICNGEIELPDERDTDEIPEYVVSINFEGLPPVWTCK